MKIMNVLQAAFAPPTRFRKKKLSVLDDSQNRSVEFKKGAKFSALMLTTTSSIIMKLFCGKHENGHLTPSVAAAHSDTGIATKIENQQL